MGKIIVYIASSKNGMIADEDGSVKWLMPYQTGDTDYGFRAMYDNIDAVVMGSKTYEKIKGFQSNFPYKDKRSFVVSSTPSGDDGDVTYINENALAFIEVLREQKGNVWVVGGSKLINYLMKHHLVDELVVTVVPIVLKGGTPLYCKDTHRYLEKYRVIPYANGVEQEIYINT